MQILYLYVTKSNYIIRLFSAGYNSKDFFLDLFIYRI